MPGLRPSFTAVPLLLLFFTSVFSVMPSHTEAAAILSVSPASSDAEEGQSFVIEVTIDDVTDLYAFQFDVAFDSSVLQADDILEGAFLGTGGATFFIPGSIDNALGVITFTANSLLGPDPGVTGNGTLATLVFTALSAGTSGIDISNVILLDSSLVDIETSTAGGSVDVRPGTVPEPGTLTLLAVGATLLRRRRRSQRRDMTLFGESAK